MPRDSSVYLQDVLDAIRKVRAYTDGCTVESFATNEMVVDAVLSPVWNNDTIPSGRK